MHIDSSFYHLREEDFRVYLEESAFLFQEIKEIFDHRFSLYSENYSFYATGSLGRNSVSFQKSGDKFIILNDLEFLAIKKTPSSPAVSAEHIQQLKNDIMGKFHVSAIDLDFLPIDSLGALPVTLFNHDLKYGSKLISGEEIAPLSLIPIHKGSIPYYYFLEQINNRLTGLNLYQQNPEHFKSHPHHHEIQLIKIIQSMGDLELGKQGLYDPDYRARFEALKSSSSLDLNYKYLFLSAYFSKFFPSENYYKFLVGLEDELLKIVKRLLTNTTKYDPLFLGFKLKVIPRLFYNDQRKITYTGLSHFLSREPVDMKKFAEYLHMWIDFYHGH
jgi:hypothetical protein